MDEEENIRYRVSGLTEEERDRADQQAEAEVCHLSTEELAAYNRRTQAELDVLYLKFGAMARLAVRILDDLSQRVRNVAASLLAIDAPWALAHGKTLLKATQDAQISRRAREGRILLGLPRPGTERLPQSGYAASGR
jgi:hypothetical protein